jgi:hypothetical protein
VCNNNGTGPVLKLEQARILLRKRSESKVLEIQRTNLKTEIKGSIKNLKSFRTKPKHPFKFKNHTTLIIFLPGNYQVT